MERYETLGLVGEGSYGAVLKCRHRESGRLVAIKKFLDSDDDKTVKKIAQREIKLLRQLRHDNLVNLLEVWKRRRRWYLVFEFVERTLLDELEQHPQGLDLNTCRQYLYQILRATAFCHQQNVIHRDIKPENILISQGGVVKLCDFGFARTVASPGEGGVYTDYVATRWYRPPELLVGDTHYGKPVDVWAVGCLLLEMLTSQPLFPGESDLDQIYHIVRCFGNLPSQHQELFHRNPLFSGVRLPECSGPVTLEQRFPSAPTAALSLAQSCLQMDPEQRPQCSELLEHSFFTHDSFHIRFSDELNTKIQKDHRENSTLPKIPKTTRQAKDEAEEKERQKHHKLPENVDEKLKTKKDKDLSEDKATKSKNKQSSKLPKASQHAPETATKQLKTTVAKDNAAKTTTSMKTKPGKPTEVQATAKMANNIPSLKAKPGKAPSPEPKQEDLSRVEEVKEGATVHQVTKQAKLAQPEQGQKYIKSYLKTDSKKMEQPVDPQNPNSITKVFRTTGEQVVIDVMFEVEESNLSAIPKIAKKSHCDSSWQIPKGDADSNADKISKSSQTLETCIPKKSELSTNPANSETNSKQKFNHSGMDLSVSKQMTIGDAKALKMPNPSHSLSKITLQSIQQPPVLPKASKNHQEVTNAGNLRIKALTNNFPLEKAPTVLLGGQQDTGKHLGKGHKGDTAGEMAGDDVLARNCKGEESSELASKTPRLEGATFDQTYSNKQPQVNKAINKVSDKENREDSVTRDLSPCRLKSEDLKAIAQTKVGNLNRSSTTLVSNKSLKGIPIEAIKTTTNAQRHEAKNSESVVSSVLGGGLDRPELFEDSLRSSPPPPPSSTPLLLPAPAVVTVTGDRSPNNQLRFIDGKQQSHIHSRPQQSISSLGPSPLPSTASERCVSCERSVMSDQSSKRKTDVHLPEVRTSTLLEHKAKDGKGQKPAASGSEGQPP